ncbi:MAG: vesicle coat component [Tremellales sp. Tagirdzhanova-0007]|nr:MAG: vesicle coat component [Tremellales sp. Tagirdzhanova-0007]
MLMVKWAVMGTARERAKPRSALKTPGFWKERIKQLQERLSSLFSDLDGAYFGGHVWNFASAHSLVIVTANVPADPGQRVDIEIIDGSERGNVYLSKRDIKDETRLAVTTHESADVGVCFRNYLESGNGRQSRIIELDVDIGADAVDYNAIANQESLSILEVEMRKLEAVVKEIVDELGYLQRREMKMRDTNGVNLGAYSHRAISSSSATIADIDSDSPPDAGHSYHEQQYLHDSQHPQSSQYYIRTHPNQSPHRYIDPQSRQPQRNLDLHEDSIVPHSVVDGRTQMLKTKTGSKRSLDMDEDLLRGSEGDVSDPLRGRKFPRIDKERREKAEEIDELDDDSRSQREVTVEKEREKEEALVVEEPFDPTAPIARFDINTELIEKWDRIQAELVPFLQDFSKTMMANTYDIIFTVTHQFHTLNETVKASLESGVKTIEAEEAKQEEARRVITDFSNEMRRVALVLKKFGMSSMPGVMEIGESI